MGQLFSILTSKRSRGRGTAIPKQGLRIAVKFQGVALKTSGSPADLAYLDLDFDKGGDGLWFPSLILVRSVGAVDHTSGVIRLHTAASSGGNALCAATTLTGLTGTANMVQSVSPTPGTTLQTATRVYLRQTTNTGNAGTIDVYLAFENLANYESAYHVAL